jgi:hypothetical protein
MCATDKVLWVASSPSTPRTVGSYYVWTVSVIIWMPSVGGA